MEKWIEEIKKQESIVNQYKIENVSALEEFRIQFLGSKGVLKNLYADIKNTPVEQKKEVGQLLNQFKNFIENHFEVQKQKFSSATVENGSQIDFSMPGNFIASGTRHPLKIIENTIVSIFEQIGFQESTGQEIEDDWHNFTSLNMPLDHPARDMQDTFYIAQNPDWVLRTHTSSVQARTMENNKPPIRIICPGRVYRNETISARAHCFFHQCEGLYIDKKVSFADLKQTLYYFVTALFGKETKVRFRPSYFPFTEPSAEMDISCTVCAGAGCSLCKHSGWVEILGCGMVHPNMLRNFNIDPEIYTGFAFGMGIERIAQIKFQVNDLRLYSQNDLRFLQQFEGA